MAKRTAWLFAGQGSQRRGMGSELFDRYPEWVEAASRILGYPVASIVRENPDNVLTRTEYTQPLLFVVNALYHRAALEEAGRGPDVLAGHSLGEYNALLVAGAFDFETGVRLVARRGQLMGRAAGGSMAAVVGLARERVAAVLAEGGLTGIDLANLNTPSQTVLSGPAADLERARPLFEVLRDGVRFHPLRVSAAFHSRYMSEAREEFARFLGDIEFRPLAIPVVSNVTARPHLDGEVARGLADQITHPVRWVESIQHILAPGEVSFREIGPGQVVSKMVDEIAAATPPPAPAATVSPAGRGRLSAETLGSAAFRAAHGIRYAYLAGAMYKGIASKELVVRMGAAGLLGFLGTGGMDLERIAREIEWIDGRLPPGAPRGMNLLANLEDPALETATVELYLARGIRCVEAAAYLKMTPALVLFRASGLSRRPDGSVEVPHRVVAKVSRPEIAELFMSPPPSEILTDLVRAGRLTAAEAELAARIPVAHDVCVEADSGGHTDQRMPYALVPAMRDLRDQVQARHGYEVPLRLGAAGGIGTPEAAAAAFVLGAEFVLTGSINQCTVEAGTSDAVKDILEGLDVQDTAYAPAGDMFELGARVQVARKGLFFPARANKLYDLYRAHESVDQIDAATRRQIEERFFRRSFDEVWEETKAFYGKSRPEVLAAAETNPRRRMALLFKWYFVHSHRVAQQGSVEHKVDFQIQCGPAMGAFNRWVRGTELESWRNRHVDDLARRIMEGAAEVLERRFRELSGG